jgi:hypothetical protein
LQTLFLDTSLRWYDGRFRWYDGRFRWYDGRFRWYDGRFTVAPTQERHPSPVTTPQSSNDTSAQQRLPSEGWGPAFNRSTISNRRLSAIGLCCRTIDLYGMDAKRVCNCRPFFWIPAFAGMTGGFAGMTGGFAGMTGGLPPLRLSNAGTSSQRRNVTPAQERHPSAGWGPAFNRSTISNRRLSAFP